MNKPSTLQEAIIYFADADLCQQFMIDLRWPDGVVKCPHCGSERVAYLKNARLWKCYVTHPRPKFSAKVGTIFEDSPIPLQKWLPALWMIANCKNGISSYELARALGVTQKSAWFMLHRIRLAMQAKSFDMMGGFGPVEVDETFIGGKARNMHKWKRDSFGEKKLYGRSLVGKVAVMRLLDRHGHGGKKHSTVRAKVIKSTGKAEIDPIVRANGAPGAEVFTDEWHAYNALNDQYVHDVINHAEGIRAWQRSHQRH